MAEEKGSLTPRETALRMLAHLPDDVSYEDIIRQLRILQRIEWVMTDIEMAAMPAEAAFKEDFEEVEEAELISFAERKSSLVLRSRPVFNWRSLAERSDERSDPLLGKASWIY